MSGGLNSASSSLKGLSDGLTKAGIAMTAAFTVPLVAAGKAAVDMAMDLDTQMRNIQSISKQTDEEIAALSDTFVDMSTNLELTTDTAQNLAAAFYDIQGSGFAGEDAMKVLEAATKAATAGLTTTDIAAGALTQTLNAYRLTADDASAVSDVLFRAVDRGVGSFEELASSLSSVTGTAASLNIPIETVAAAMATMSKQGFSFSEASVALNQAMTAILKPSEAMAKAINSLGYASGQAMIDALGFDGAMQALRESTHGSDSQLAAMFGNVRGLRAAFALTGANAQSFSEDLEAMGAAAGATGEAFAIQTKSFEAQWKNFSNTLNAMLIEVGQIILPVLTDFLQNVLIPIIQAFRSLPEPMQAVIVGFLAILAAIGPILLIAGQLISLWGTLTTIFAALPAVIGAVGTAFNFLMANPIVLAIGLIVAAIALLITHFEEIKTTVGMLVEMVVRGWQMLFAEIGRIINEIVTLIGEKGLVGAFIELGGNIINGLINGMKNAAIDLVAYVFGLSEDLKNAVKRALGIASPSKVFMDIGENVVKGFHEGIASMGGISASVQGGNVIAGQPITRSAPAMVGAGMGATQIFNIYPPQGTSAQQIDHIVREVGKRIKQKGGSSRR